jgi:hypothetical protein
VWRRRSTGATSKNARRRKRGRQRPNTPVANPIERLNGEIKRRNDIGGIFPSDAALVPHFGALRLEQNDEWAVQRALYLTLESVGYLSDNPRISPQAAAR